MEITHEDWCPSSLSVGRNLLLRECAEFERLNWIIRSGEWDLGNHAFKRQYNQRDRRGTKPSHLKCPEPRNDGKKNGSAVH
jgi:hypothetical protein